MPKHSNDNARERIVIIENGADLTPDVVVREAFTTPEPGLGPWEDLRRAVESGSIRDEVRALEALHASLFGSVATQKKAA